MAVRGREAANVADPEQARENRAYVRRLLKEKQPEFAQALELVLQELIDSRTGATAPSSCGGGRPWALTRGLPAGGPRAPATPWRGSVPRPAIAPALVVLGRSW
jgi:hypothetical protein